MKFVKHYLSYFFSCIRNLSDFAVRSLFFLSEMPSGHLPHSVPPPYSLWNVIIILLPDVFGTEDHSSGVERTSPSLTSEWTGPHFIEGPRSVKRTGTAESANWCLDGNQPVDDGKMRGDCSSGDARCEDKYWSDTRGREDKTCDIKPLRLRDVFPMCD